MVGIAHPTVLAFNSSAVNPKFVLIKDCFELYGIAIASRRIKHITRLAQFPPHIAHSDRLSGLGLDGFWGLPAVQGSDGSGHGTGS